MSETAPTLDVIALGHPLVDVLSHETDDVVARTKVERGAMTMVDDKGPDDKIIAIHADDPEYAHYRDISELSGHRLKELERFFLDYKVLEHKAVTDGDMHGRVEAERLIREAAQLYRERIKPTRR